MSLFKFLDRLGVNLARVQTVALVVILGFGIASVAKNGINRRELSGLVERVTGLNVENDILHNDIKARDTLLSLKDLQILRLNDSIGLSQARYNRLFGTYQALTLEYDNLAGELLAISVDSSYNFLDKTAYPFTGVKKYPFNEPQVRGIHLTYLEHITLTSINENLAGQVDELTGQLVLKDTVIETTASKMLLVRRNRDDLEEIIVNKDEEIEIKTDALKKQRRGKRFWQILAAGALVVLGVMAVSG